MVEPSITDLPDIDQFYHAYGRALAHWAEVEFRLCAWFQIAADMTIGRGEAVFFSGRSFQTRAEMLGAVLECGKLEGAWRSFVTNSVVPLLNGLVRGGVRQMRLPFFAFN
jgi:hypothetical protein